VSATNLEILDSSLDYQLWAIVDGKPVDAGILKTTDVYALPQKMISFSSAQAFAITIENKGGSEVPTLDKMVALGGV
jgi:anti-sigma-K factor RskA